MGCDLFIKKINLEYEYFYQNIIKDSKASIFAKSAEIERVKNITKYLKKRCKSLNETVQIGLFAKEGILEECNRFIDDHAEYEMEEALENLIQAWLHPEKEI